MRLAGRAEAVIAGPRPQGPANRLFREFLDALAQEFRTSPPPMDPMGLAAFFGDWGDARQELYFAGQVKTVPIRSEQSQEAGAQSRPGPGETVEHIVVGMLFKQLFDLLVKLGDRFDQGPNLAHQGLHHQG